jgi:hypothetical protein
MQWPNQSRFLADIVGGKKRVKDVTSSFPVHALPAGKGESGFISSTISA